MTTEADPTRLSPVRVPAALVNASPHGVVPNTDWTDDTAPLRWLPSGMQIQVFNYGGSASFRRWTAPWNAKHSDLDPDDDRKTPGVRPAFPDAFLAMTFVSSDEGALPAWSQAEVRTRAEQVHRLQEQVAVEVGLAERMLADVGTLDTADDLVGALSRLEGQLAQTSTLGFIHASAEWAASAAQANLLRYQNGKLLTPMGNQWVFGGGYVEGLQDKLIATSPTQGLRGPLTVRDGMNLEHNRYQAIAERSLVVGYEALIGAVDVTG